MSYNAFIQKQNDLQLKTRLAETDTENQTQKQDFEVQNAAPPAPQQPQQSLQEQAEAEVEKQQEKEDQEEEEDNEQDDQMLAEEKIEIPSISNQEVTSEVVSIFKNQEHSIEKNIKLIEDANKLFTIIQGVLAPMRGTSNDPKEQMNFLEQLTTQQQNSQLLAESLSDKAQQKRNTVLRTYQLKLIEKIQLLKWEAYDETYFFFITDLWQIIDMKFGVQLGPSIWTFSKTDLFGHNQALSQSAIIVAQEEIPTIILLKFKDFHDKQIHFSYLIKDSGSGGIILRCRDVFNFYFLQINTQGLTFGKFLNGERFIIKQKQRPLEIAKWYRFRVRIQAYLTLVQIYDDEGPDTPYDEINIGTKFEFQAEDHVFFKGQFGFFSNATKGVLYDNIKIEPLNCIDVGKEKKKESDKIPYKLTKINDQISPDVKIIHPLSSRFKQSYQGPPNQAFKFVSPLNKYQIINGTAKWEYATQFGRAKILVQDSSTTTEIGERATLALFKNKMCYNCIFQSEIYMDDEKGKVGMVFMVDYKNPQFYYQLEFSTKQVILKKVNEDQVSRVAFSLQIRIKQKKWYTVRLKISKQLDVYINEERKPRQKIFEAIKLDNPQSKDGEIGFFTIGTRAGFDKYHIQPPNDPQEHPLFSTGNSGNGDNQFNGEKDEDDIGFQDNEGYIYRYDQVGKAQTGTIPVPSIWCKKEFEQNSPDVISVCIKNYPEFWCSKNVEEGSEQRMNHCVNIVSKQHSLGKHVDEEKVSQNPCINFPHLKQAYPYYCNKKFFSESVEFNIYCKIDLCKLCCTYTDVVFNVYKYDDELNKCHAECRKYFEQIDMKSIRSLTYIPYYGDQYPIQRNAILEQKQYEKRRR